MNGVTLYVRSHWDRLVVVLYVIFIAASLIIYPARTVTTNSVHHYFKNCSGEWENAVAAQGASDILTDDYFDFEKIAASSTQWKSGALAIECSEVLPQSDSKNIISGGIHIVGFVKDLSGGASSAIQIAAIENLLEVSPATTTIVSEEFVETANLTTSANMEADIKTVIEPIESDSIQTETVVEPSVEQISEDHRLIDVQYFVEGNDWKSAGIIDNLSEKTFMFPINFEGISDQNIGSLRVRLVGVSEKNDQVFYVDSIWVSLDSVIDDVETKTADINSEKSESTQLTALPIVMSDKGAPPPFEGIVIENPAIIIPEPEKVIVDPVAQHVCELADYHVRLDRVIGANKSVDVLLSGAGGASSTLHAARIPEGLSFMFENGLDEIGLLENQVSAKMSISVTQEIESRSFNVPIVYSKIRPDLAKSSSLCYLNVIVE